MAYRSKKGRFARIPKAFIAIFVYCTVIGTALAGMKFKEALAQVPAEPRPIYTTFRKVADDPMDGVEIIEVDAEPVKAPQELKDAITIACLRHYNGPQASDCYLVLLSIAKVETGWNNESVGDQGHSYGYFQLYTKVHRHISKEQAKNPRFAAEWTLTRLEKYGYPKEKSWAIGSHNSLTPSVNAKYSAKVLAVYEQLKEQGL